MKNWKETLNESDSKADRELFFTHVKKLNLRNSIFIDNTASEEIAEEYVSYLKNSIGVVTCNKIACASSLKNYNNLKNTARRFVTPFLFETNVGAALPIVDTLNNLIASGDKILEIQAILSGSGTSNPILEYLPEDYEILVGTNVFASGKDGIFSSGTPVGITNIDGTVDLFIDPNQLSFVTVNLNVQSKGKL